jgi:hypothetical protein
MKGAGGKIMPHAKRPRSDRGFLPAFTRYYSAIAGANRKQALPEAGVGDDFADYIHDILRALESDPSLKTSKGRFSYAYILLTDAANKLGVIAAKKRSTRTRPFEPTAFPLTAQFTSHDFYLLVLHVWKLTRLIGPQKPGPRPLERRRRRAGRPRIWDPDDPSSTSLLTILDRFRAAMAAQGKRPTDVGAMEAALRAYDQTLPPGERFSSARERNQAARKLAKRIPDLRRRSSRK